MSDEKICIKCDLLQPLVRFPKHPNATGGRITVCQSCVNALARINRKKHSEKYAEKAKRNRRSYAEYNKKCVEEIYSERNLRFKKFCNRCSTEKTRADFWKDIAKFDGFSTYCAECNSKHKRERYKSDPTVKEKLDQNKKKSNYQIKAKQWRDNNKPLIKELNKKWREENRELAYALNARRREQVQTATPKWVNQSEIGKIYLLSQKLTEQTGIRHHVDHRIPLIHKSICGLHVSWNLCPIPANTNQVKKNKLLEEFAICTDAPGIKFLSKGCPPITWAEILAYPSNEMELLSMSLLEVTDRPNSSPDGKG